MKRLTLAILAVVIIFMLAAAGCGEQPVESGENGNNGENGINGDNGETIVDQRIISLIPSNTEVLFALGLGESVVGVTDFCNYPPEMETAVAEGRIQRVGDAHTLNEELIVSLEPTLVLFGFDNEEVVSRLNSLGIVTAVISPRSIDEAVESIITIGELTGRQGKARLLADEMETGFAAVAEKTAALSDEEKPRVAFVLDLEWLFVAGSGTLEDELIALAGGINAFEIDGYDSVSEEVIVESRPHIILGGFPYREQILAEKEAWKEIPAVKNEKVHDIDGDIVNRPTPRLVEGLRQLLDILHPDL